MAPRARAELQASGTSQALNPNEPRGSLMTLHSRDCPTPSLKIGVSTQSWCLHAATSHGQHLGLTVGRLGSEGCQGAEDPGSGKNFLTPPSVSQGLVPIHAAFQPAGFCCVPGSLYVCGQRTREGPTRHNSFTLCHHWLFVSCQEESQCSSIGDDTSPSARPQAAQTEPWTKMRDHG